MQASKAAGTLVAEVSDFLEPLDKYIAKRREERAAARAWFRRAALAVLAILKILRWGEKRMLVVRRAAVRGQAVIRARIAKQKTA